MPSFYPRPHPHQLPLTPPEYDPVTKRVRDMTVSTQMPYVPYLHPCARYDKGAIEGPDHHKQTAAFGLPSAIYPPPTIQPTAAYNAASKSNVVMPNHSYGPISAPILPPIRAHEKTGRDAHAGLRDDSLPDPRYPRETVKEDKAVGGVAAHLDYRMDDMSDFVSEMAQGMYDLYQSKICLADIDIIRSIQPSSPVSSTFRKFVSQILSSTRLPSSTILLGLYYLSDRVDKLSACGEFKTSSGHVYRLLTIALLLGSKFLDDNTFQNRSWSEVTGLPVSELNTLEAQWLGAIDWKLHKPHEQQQIMAWRGHWEDWQGQMAARSVNALKLSPVDHDAQRQRPQHKPISPIQPGLPSYSNASTPNVGNDLRPMPYQAPIHYDYPGWHYPHAGNEHSPPSAPNTGPNTPDYLGMSGAWSSLPPPPPYSARQGPHIMSQPPSYHHTPYVPPHTHNIWNGHGPACGCVYCVRPNDRYLGIHHSYVPQSVVG